eukprot:TRINITY_DN10179_c0_g1_i2.p1 TRINITY_DN10179_c0_g1~~TRINITY_DN10179_c0_g1_i2.p1  ORF type:complete len:892 (-),score=158.13 TRINITY_DN10179_c0_g1_i2:229-2904(-)
MTTLVKPRCVVLPAEEEEQLRHVFNTINVSGGVAISTRDLVMVCKEKKEISLFFGLGEDPELADVIAFFADVDDDGSKSVDWGEMKLWYFGVLRELIGKKLESSLPPAPVWVATGGQRRPDAMVKRISQDDLMEAALRGDVGLARRLIEGGCSVNAPLRPFYEDEYMTLAHVLASKPELPNCTRILAELLHRAADVDARTTLGSTPLIYACISKHLGAAEVLLQSGADISVVDDHSQTPLVCAVSAGTIHKGSVSESISCELVALLSKWGCNMNVGASRKAKPPMTEAVLQGSVALVRTLLQNRTIPVGLHEAVEVKDMEIIRLLIEAEANPFPLSADGLTVLEAAIAIGSTEIADVLRDFISQLERDNHHFLKTRVGGKFGKNRGSKANDSTGFDKNILTLELSRSEAFKKRIQSIAASIIKNNYFHAIMLIVLLVALVAPDLFVLFLSLDTTLLDITLAVVFFAFLLELVLQIIGSWSTYACSFFFWMDLCGLFSVPLDCSFIAAYLVSSNSSLDNPVLVRTTRLAKLGARAGRFTKLVKIMKFLPGLNTSAEKGNTAKYLAIRVNGVLSPEISGLIILMFMTLPIFDFWRFPGNDNSLKAWVGMIDDTAVSFPEGMAELLEDFSEFFVHMNYFPYEVRVKDESNKVNIYRLPADLPLRAADRIQLELGKTEVFFNFAEPNKIESICNLILIMMISVMMISASLMVSQVVSTVVLHPLEVLMDCIHTVTRRVFNSVNAVATTITKKEDPLKDFMTEDDGSENEIRQLSEILKKLQTMAELLMRKKRHDKEDLEKMGEDERKVLEAYVCHHAVHNDWESEDTVVDEEEEEEEDSGSGSVDDARGSSFCIRTAFPEDRPPCVRAVCAMCLRDMRRRAGRKSHSRAQRWSHL